MKIKTLIFCLVLASGLVLSKSSSAQGIFESLNEMEAADADTAKEEIKPFPVPEIVSSLNKTFNLVNKSLESQLSTEEISRLDINIDTLVSETDQYLDDSLTNNLDRISLRELDELIFRTRYLSSNLNQVLDNLMAKSQARRFSSRYHTFLTKRFDRIRGEHIHFASAMTLLGYNDGQNYEDEASYLDLVEFIIRNGANVKADLEELWRRIVFSICVSNTDDHLRNHGFILTEQGWIPSPAFDINPIETGTGLKLNISENDNILDLELALDVHEQFRLNREKASEIIKQVRDNVLKWRDIANKYGISRMEHDIKALAFSRATIG